MSLINDVFTDVSMTTYTDSLRAKGWSSNLTLSVIKQSAESAHGKRIYIMKVSKYCKSGFVFLLFPEK